MIILILELSIYVVCAIFVLDGFLIHEPKLSSLSGIALTVWNRIANLVTCSQVVHMNSMQVFALFKNFSGFLSDRPNMV